MRDKVKLIAFDADQTLFDFQKKLHEALKTVSEYLRQHGVVVTVDQLQSKRDYYADLFRGKQIRMLDLRRQSFENIVGDVRGKTQIVAEALDMFERTRFGIPHYYPGVIETLSVIAPRYQTALVTNGNSDPSKAEIACYFDHIILGEEFPFKKPDRRIFLHLMKVSKVRDPGSVIFIGDSLINDVEGANNAGMRSVWFNLDKIDNDTSIVPDHEISEMRELITILNQESKL